MLSWFKMHDDFADDPKLRMYFSESEQLSFVRILCLANRSRQRGVILSPVDEIAYVLEKTEAEWESLLAKFTAKRMLHLRDDGAIVVTHWNDRQYDKPSDAPEKTRERQQSSRATKSITAKSHAVSRGVTPPDSVCHAASRGVTPQNRRETDTDTDKKTTTETEQNAGANVGAVSSSDAVSSAPDVVVVSLNEKVFPDCLPDVDLIERLVRELEISEDVARRLVQEYPERCLSQLAYSRYTPPPENPGAFWRKAIENDYAAPPGYRTAKKAEQAQASKAESDRQRREQAHAAEQNKQREEADYEALRGDLQSDPVIWRVIEAKAQAKVQADARTLKLGSPPRIALEKGTGRGFDIAYEAALRCIILAKGGAP